MQYYDFKKELLENSIKLNKSSLRSCYIWFSFIFSLLVFNLYFMSKPGHTCITDICIGIDIVIALMNLLIIWEYRIDIEYDKKYLLKIEEYLDDEMLKGAIKQYQRAKEYYDDYIISHSANSACHENKPPE